MTCTGGTGGQIGGGSPHAFIGGTGGTATVNSPALELIKVNGGDGGAASGTLATNICGGMGAAGPFGGAAGNNIGTENGRNAAVNSGAGGGSPGSTSTLTSGTGGGAGAYAVAIIPTPSATYSYAVGAAGLGGGSGTGGKAGGNGGSGVIIVEEFYI